MKIGKIALKIRLANTRFKQYVAGAAELDIAMQSTMMIESAFIVPLGESSQENRMDGGIQQRVTERFGVIVAIKSDISQTDKPQILAYDTIHDVRSEIFRAILGWQMMEAESPITYRGGSLLGIDGAWMWYQFEFEYKSIIISQGEELRYADIEVYDWDEDDQQSLPEFDRLYANFIQSTSNRLPYTGSLPLPDGYPDVLIPDMAQMVTRRDPREGEFNFEFGSAFPFYDEDRRY